MNNIKKYLVSTGFTLGSIIIFTILISILNYFELLNDSVINILKLVITAISPLIGGVYIGSHSERNGYQNGIKFGIIFSIICFILALFFRMISWGFIILFIIAIVFSMIGSMIGINNRKTA